MNQKGSALILALVLCLTVLPAAGVLVAIAGSDLESALDDYHLARARRAVWAGMELVAQDLLAGGPGQASWPDPDITLEIGVAEGDKDWIITLTARSGRATATCTQTIMKPQEEEDEPIPAG